MVSTMAQPFLGLGRLAFSIFFCILISTSVVGDPSLLELEALHLPSELEQLKSKISFLESKIDERDYELRKKDQIILQLETSIREKSIEVVTLECEIAFLRQKGPSDSKEHTSKEYSHTRTDKLEKQVRGSCHSGFAVHLSHLQIFWNESGRPVANKAYRELLERKAQVQQWLKIQVEIIVTEWIPNFIEQCLVFTTYVKPHVRCCATKTVDMYYQVKDYAVPQALQFLQETKVFTKPYMDQMVTVAKLRLENAQLALQPYQKNVAGAYQKIINFAASYHHQVHGGWYSRWFAGCLSHLQSLWNENGGVVANKAYQKVLESKAQVWQWLGIHP